MKLVLKAWVCLFTFCIVLVILSIYSVPNVNEIHSVVDHRYPMSLQFLWSNITMQRDFQILNDGKYVYLLDLRQYREEFPYLQDYKCNKVSEPKNFCARSAGFVNLILAIKSQPGSFDRRHALRKTWAQPQVIEDFLINPVFLMATTSNHTQMILLEKEMLHYQDIILWDFMENHANLSLKEFCFLEWMMYNCVTDFVFKGDDDEFVYPPAIVKYLKRTPDASSFIHGNLRVHTEVLRKGKYKISYQLYSMNVLPTFVSGSGFIIPGILIPSLYRAATVLPVFPLDDVYFGFLAIKANITLKHGHGFYCWGLKFDACKYRNAVLVHSLFEYDEKGMSPEQLLDVWEKVITEENCTD
ncbi:B3GN3 acetylglucosaminyltransferase, partial [Polypterus senegalus]